MKKPIVLIAAIVAVVGLGAVVAVAKEKIKVGTSVTLGLDTDLSGPKPDWFVGEVTARKKGCEKGRKVVVYFPKPPDPRGRLGSDRTNDRGKYRIPLAPRPVFFAEAKEKKITKNDGDKIVCKEGRSKKFRP